MKRGMFVAVLLVAVAGAVSAGIVLAQLGDTQTASGTINATTTSADLYICEPNSTPGPACGSDDSGADEAVFETLEDIRPGDVVEWDIRLQNVGTVDWTVTDVIHRVVETADPGGTCGGSGALSAEALNPFGGSSPRGVFILGKNGDSINDNPSNLPGLISLRREDSTLGQNHVKVAAGDYEDVRLRLTLRGDRGDCSGAEWDVSWEFEVQ